MISEFSGKFYVRCNKCYSYSENGEHNCYVEEIEKLKEENIKLMLEIAPLKIEIEKLKDDIREHKRTNETLHEIRDADKCLIEDLCKEKLKEKKEIEKLKEENKKMKEVLEFCDDKFRFQGQVYPVIQELIKEYKLKNIRGSYE